MNTKESIIRDLKKMNIDPTGTVIAHFSYKAMGETEGGPETVIDALMEFMKDGLLVIPTHTWHNIGIDKSGGNNMNVLTTPVCIGIIPELFRKREGVIRSLHPTHSVGAYGRDAAEFVEGEQYAQSPCPKNSVWHKLLERKAVILLVGVNFTRNTFIHGIEEWNGVPDILTGEAHDLYVTDKGGNVYHTPQHRHCSPLGSATYWKLEDAATKKGVTFKRKLGEAVTTVCDAVKLNDMVSEMLAANINLLSNDEPIAEG